MSFQENLRRYREKAGMTRLDLANACGLSNTAIGQYETGKREPQANTLIAIATALHISTDTLLGYNQGLEKPKRSCPFCGGNDIEVYEHYGTAAGIEYGGFYPECTECGCRLNYYKSRKAAVDAWDRRWGEYE